MTLKIVADENIPGLQRDPDHGVKLSRVAGRGIQAEHLTDADILLVRSVTRVDQSLLSESPVRFVGSATSGFDHIDRTYLQRRGIVFAHAPGANANAVVEYVLTAIAAVGDTLEELLHGAAVGIIGYGHVGSALAARLHDLGIDHKVYDPWLDPAVVGSAASLDDVLDCSVVTLHPELTHAKPWPSYHLLGAEELSQLRPNTLLINASRGAIIDNQALL
ncbi:MAG: 4-phosphoerythronate dehydrogenase, partial [Halioglobus sp.]|nr:4-phosphoerythronate dehydrogenase [Halioglobus sp.]